MSSSLLDLIATSLRYKSVYHILDNVNTFTRNGLIASSNKYVQSLHREGYAVLPFIAPPATKELSPFFKGSIKSSQLYDLINQLNLSVLDILQEILKLNPLVSMTLQELKSLYVVDEVSVLNAVNSENNGSDFWHRDGSGHRFKVFLPLLLVGDTPNTSVLAKSHHCGSHPMNWEMLRVNQLNPNQHQHQEVIPSLFSNCDIFEYRWSYNSCLIIDTNAIHRAHSFSNSSLNTCGGRLFYSIELIDPFSSFLVRKYKLGGAGTKANVDLISTVIAATHD